MLIFLILSFLLAFLILSFLLGYFLAFFYKGKLHLISQNELCFLWKRENKYLFFLFYYQFSKLKIVVITISNGGKWVPPFFYFRPMDFYLFYYL